MNSCNFIGNLGNDPEISYSSSSKDQLAIARFSIAVENPFNHEADPNWLRCVAFGKKAEVIGEYFKKGSKIGITTHVQTGSYEDEDGITRYTTDFIVDSITFCEKADTPKEAQKGKNTKSNKGSKRPNR